jgi:hypothetical protein
VLAGFAAGLLLVAAASPAPVPSPAASSAPAFHFVQVGGRSVMRAAEAERLLTARIVPALESQLDGASISAVRCEGDLIADGRKQTCSVAVDGVPLRIRVTALDLGEGTGPLWIHTDQSLLDLRKIEKAGLTIVQGIDPSVDAITCSGARWRAVEVDEMFVCGAHTSAGKAERVLVRSTNDLGEVDLSVIP